MKKVIITGCSKGIGQSITEVLLSNDYYVLGCSRNKNDFIKNVENTHENFTFIEADLSKEDDLNSIIQELEKDEFYALVNNAGVGLDGILATLPVLDIEKLISLNLKAPILLSRAMSRNIIKYKTAGRIVNISSIISQSGYNGLSVYSATKAGLNGLTISLARELGRTGTTVNAILPGYIKTEMTDSLTTKQLNQIIRRTPLNKLTETRDISSMVNFLLSNDANSITGQLIKIDNGVTV